MAEFNPESLPKKPRAATHSIPEPDINDPRMEAYIAEQNKETTAHDSIQRLSGILETVHTDENALKLIHETMKSIFRYVEAIYNAEVTMQIEKYRLEGNEYQDTCERLDRRRSQAHDALIASLTACNRYLFQTYGEEIPVGGICTADPVALQANQRLAVADWAIELEYEILQGRKR